PTGAVKTEQAVQFIKEMAISPGGDVYFVEESSWCYGQIQVLRGGTGECAFPGNPYDQAPIVDLLFGSDGRLYRAARTYTPTSSRYPDSLQHWGHVDVFFSNPPTQRSLAHIPHLQALTFQRDAQGNMTSRLVAVQQGEDLSRIVELNGSGRPAGADFAVRFFHATLDPLPPAN